MSQQSSSQSRAFFECALKEYRTKTGIIYPNTLAIQLERIVTVEVITAAFL